ncbi:MAG: hypothetical protein C0617_13465, partial [Desulfuromonas sp.]
MNDRSLLRKSWALLCSLKLAIVLASAATLLSVGGSLVMPFNPRVFGAMDSMPLGQWFSSTAAGAPGLSWWLYAVSALILLLGLNTLCCFLDWLPCLRMRWRKTGEYLIHLGFVLVLTAFIWGSLDGIRSEGNRIFVGETTPLEAMPGYSLRLEAFEPVIAPSGRPMDMLNTLALLAGNEVVMRRIVKTNSPLTYKGLAVLPASYGNMVEGFRFFMAGAGETVLRKGTRLDLPGGATLRVLNFLPQALRQADGGVANGGEAPRNPAMELELLRPHREPWRGWYFLREGLPFPLVETGVRLWPTNPVFRPYSLLTINRDPGAA